MAEGWRKSSYSYANGQCVEAHGRWAKSSYSQSNGHCVEWRKSSRCDAGACTEVAACPDGVLVRDSQLGEASPVLAFGAGVWREFVVRIKAGWACQ